MLFVINSKFIQVRSTVYNSCIIYAYRAQDIISYVQYFKTLPATLLN